MSRSQVTYTRIVPVPEDVSDRLRRDGFVHLPGLLEPAQIGLVFDDVYAALRDHGWLPGAASESSVTRKLGRQEGSEGWWAGYRQIQALERFHRLAHVPPLRQLAARFFPTSFVHTRKIANLVYPQFAVPPHQDFPAVQGSVDTLDIWVPLSEARPGSGALLVAVGSHRAGVAPMRQLPQAGVTLQQRPDGDWVSIAYTPGDVVLLHSLVVHEISANRSSEIDISADFRVQDARDPVAPASLLPHHYPRVPSARTLSKGWSSRRWIRRPLVARTQVFTMPPTVEQWHEVLDPGGGRLLAVDGDGPDRPWPGV